MCKSGENLHAHHIRFRSQQGDDSAENLITLCNDCHDSLHDKNILIVAKSGNLDEPVDANAGVKIILLNGWKPKLR